MSLRLRLCQVYPRYHGGDAVVPDRDLERAVNQAALSGVIAAKPQREPGHDGDPVTLLLISFKAPHQRTDQGVVCCVVEVPGELAKQHRAELRAGEWVLISGELTGAGLLAASIATRTTKPSFD